MQKILKENNCDIYKYQELKKKLDFVFENIHFNRVVSLNIWDIASGKKKLYSLKHLALCLFSYRFYPLILDKSIFSTYGAYTRKDHKLLYDNVIKKICDYTYSLDISTCKRKISFHPIVIIKVLSFILSVKGISLWNKLGLGADLIFYCNSLLELKKNDFSRVKKYLSMCNVLDCENLITQYMKLCKIPTYSLMEGLYFIHKINPPMGCVAYENFETDYLLSWGNFTRNDFEHYGINPEKILIAGYPKEVKLTPIRKKKVFKNCLVLLGGPTYYETNSRLLDILEQVSDNYHFNLKLHPALCVEQHAEWAAKNNGIVLSQTLLLSDCLLNDNYDFTISVNTTAYYEALMKGIPSLRFYDESFTLIPGCDFDIFSNVEELKYNLHCIQDMHLSQYQYKVNKMLEYCMGIGIDNYRKILCDR